MWKNIFNPFTARHEAGHKHHTGEKASYKTTEALIQAGARPLAEPILDLERFRRRKDRPRIEQTPPTNPKKPTGPFKLAQDECSLIIYVPRNIVSRLVDHMTGDYGYSHVTIDCGEIDTPTNKRVMVESMPGDVVHRAFQDEYGQRPYLRIPLNHWQGIDIHEFRKQILSKLGEAYDDEEALTWGMVDDPAKQVCSDLATVCLPESVQSDIAELHREGRLKPWSVSVHVRRNGQRTVFVSPNGFAQYFGAPPGSYVDSPDCVFEPSPVPWHSNEAIKRGLAWGSLLLASLAILGIAGGWWYFNKR